MSTCSTVDTVKQREWLDVMHGIIKPLYSLTQWCASGLLRHIQVTILSSVTSHAQTVKLCMHAMREISVEVGGAMYFGTRGAGLFLTMRRKAKKRLWMQPWYATLAEEI